jgi:hypothetical protein
MLGAGEKYAVDIARVRGQLLQLETELSSERDSQAWFLALYRTTTTRCKWLVEGISRRDHPRHGLLQDMDARLIRDIVVHFEPRYTDPLRAYGEGRLDADDPWYPVFRHSAQSGPFATMLLGAHTHIAFDLPVVLASQLECGRWLYDDDDPMQARTFLALNQWFSMDIGRAAVRVCRVSAIMGQTDPPALCGRFRSRRLRQWTMPLWTFMLVRSRQHAVRDAGLIRDGRLHEAELASRVWRNNRRLLGICQRMAIGNGSARRRDDAGYRQIFCGR